MKTTEDDSPEIKYCSAPCSAAVCSCTRSIVIVQSNISFQFSVKLGKYLISAASRQSVAMYLFSREEEHRWATYLHVYDSVLVYILLHC